jgi:hypothetical protein
MTEETQKKWADFFVKLHNASIRDIIALTVVVGCFVLLFKLITNPLPVENGDTFKTLAGALLGAAMTGVIGFYFTSSKVDKNDSNK